MCGILLGTLLHQHSSPLCLAQPYTLMADQFSSSMALITAQTLPLAFRWSCAVLPCSHQLSFQSITLIMVYSYVWPCSVSHLLQNGTPNAWLNKPCTDSLSLIFPAATSSISSRPSALLGMHQSLCSQFPSAYSLLLEHSMLLHTYVSLLMWIYVPISKPKSLSFELLWHFILSFMFSSALSRHIVSFSPTVIF